VVLAQALPHFYKPTVLSVLFFVFLSLFLLFGASALAYSVSRVFALNFGARDMHAAIVTAGLGFLLGLLFVIKPGIYIMDIVSHFIIYNILIAVLLETMAAGWFFGEKFESYLNKNSLFKAGAAWKMLSRYVIPPIILVILIFQIKNDYLLNYRNYPLWSILVFGVGVVIVPVAVGFLMPRFSIEKGK